METASIRAREAVRMLMSPSGAERERAERTLLDLGEAAVPALVDALAPDGEVPQRQAIGRAALLLAALGARSALPAVVAAARRLADSLEHGAVDRLGDRLGDRLVGAELAVVARAMAELVDARDAFDERVREVLELVGAVGDPAARVFVVDALGALGDARSRARIEVLANDRDADVRHRAHAALTRVAASDGAALADLAALVDAAHRAAGVAFDDGPLKPWLDDLGDPRRPVRDAAVAALVRAGRAAVPSLLRRLDQPATRPRIGAALALGRLQPPDATGPLLVAATAPASSAEDHELRIVALRALSQCLTGEESGLAPSLFPLARDGDRFVRAAALSCLGRIGDRCGLAVIVDALDDQDPFVVESAAVALTQAAREDDIELIVPLLRALAQTGPQASTASTASGTAGHRRAQRAVKDAVLIALARIDVGDPALRVRVRHAVRADVDSDVISARKAAIVLLERLYSAEDPPPLPLVDAVLCRLNDEHPDVRVVAGSFVARHLPPGFTGAPLTLGRALRAAPPALALLCLDALRRHDTHEARAVVVEVAAGDDDIAARARGLLDDFAPSTTTWQYRTPAPVGGDRAPAPPVHHTRRRPAADEPRVEARFVDGADGPAQLQPGATRQP